jgi:hypothetical protein
VPYSRAVRLCQRRSRPLPRTNGLDRV